MPNPIGSTPGIEPVTARDTATIMQAAGQLLPRLDTAKNLPLQGKNIGLLCDSDCESTEMSCFSRAATGLGAHVAQIRLGLRDLRGDGDLQRIVGVLGRLYDTLACPGAAPGPLRDFCKEIALPLLDQVARGSRHLAQLAEGLEADAPLDHKRQAVMQAALIRSLG